MKRKASVIMALLLTSLLLLTGCPATVPQEEYDALSAERDALMTERDARVAQLNAAQKKIEGLQAERDSALSQITDLLSKQDTTLTELADLQSEQEKSLAEIADLQAERDTVLSQIADLQGERDAALSEIAQLQAELDTALAQIANLQEQIGTTTTSVLVEEAWDTAVERYTSLRESIDFDLEGLAPWVKLPERPAWFDSARICSAVLVDEPGAFEAVCLITSPDQQLFMSLSEYEGMKTVVCRGGSQEYVTTIARDEEGNITEVTMLAGDSLSILTWTEVEGEKVFNANVDGEIYEVPWSDDPTEFENFCTGTVHWLGTTDKTEGLIVASDQPLMLLGMGVLSNLSGIVFTMGWLEIAQRLATDFMEGVPASCY